MLYRDLGILPLLIHIKSKVLLFWNKILSSKQESMCYILYIYVSHVVLQKYVKTPMDS
jgi:hypothetical protein